MAHVFAAVFHPPTLDNLGTKNASQRLSEMKVAIQQAYGQLTSYAGLAKATNPFYVFVAPEYYFVKAETTAGVGKDARIAWTLYTETEKKQIFEELRGLSARYKRYLVAPGSLAWFKPAKAPQDGRTKDGWNTAPVFYEGKLKHEYDKIFDDGTCSRNTTDVRFQKGNKSQLFTVESLKFGIEVCGDFEHGNLGKEARGPSLDFELMLSATNRHGFDENMIAKVPVRDGGYFIHADSDKPELCGAWCVQRGSGSHGVVTPNSLQGAALYDPWTGQAIKGDSLGRSLASGNVLALTAIAVTKTGNLPQQSGSLRSSGAWTPGKVLQRTSSMPQIGLKQQPMPLMPTASSPPTPQATYRILIEAAPVQPFLNSVDGSFHVKVKVTLTSNNAGLGNQQVTFRAGNGKAQDLVKSTNMQGMVETVFTGNKSQPMQMSASFDTSTVSYEAKIASMGGGNVSRIARLQPETVLEMWSYYLPI
jgi:hypothetical protein